MDLFDIVAARVGSGSGGGAPQIQSDWAQNDSSKKDYVKNRTHWKEEVERDYTVLPNITPDPITEFIEYGKKIGLEIGKEYTLEAHLKNDTIQTIQATATEFPVDEFGIAGIPCIMVENTCSIVDGVVFDLVTETVIAGDNCYYQYDSRVIDFVEKGVITNLPNVETVFHKIPSEYLPDTVTSHNYNPESSAPISGKGVYDALNNYNYVGRYQISDNSIETRHIVDGAVTEEKYCRYVGLITSSVPQKYSVPLIEFKSGNIGAGHKYRIGGTMYLSDSATSPSAEIQYIGIVVNDDLMDFIEVDCSKGNSFDIGVILTRYNDSFYELNLYLRQTTINGSKVEILTYSKTMVANGDLKNFKFTTFDKDHNTCYFITGTTLYLDLISD